MYVWACVRRSKYQLRNEDVAGIDISTQQPLLWSSLFSSSVKILISVSAHNDIFTMPLLSALALALTRYLLQNLDGSDEVLGQSSVWVQHKINLIQYAAKPDQTLCHLLCYMMNILLLCWLMIIIPESCWFLVILPASLIVLHIQGTRL